MSFGAILLLLDEDWAEAERLATRALDLSEDYGFPRWRGNALVSRGRAFVEQGDGDRGLGEIREGLDELRRTGMRLGDSLFFSDYAGACLRLNHVDEGLAAADTGLAHCRNTTERLFEAELWRLKGELLLRRVPRTTRERHAAIRNADECFEKARVVARAQRAPMLERRASSKDARIAAVP